MYDPCDQCIALWELGMCQVDANLLRNVHLASSSSEEIAENVYL